MATITPITIPSLSSATYGTDIEAAFITIDNNFNILANHDFIKGEDGDSIIIENVKLIKNLPKNPVPADFLGQELYNALKDALNAGSELSVIDKDGISYEWDSNIDSTEYFVVLTKIKRGFSGLFDYIGSATPILFFDYRFSSTVMNNTEPSNYSNINDLSCIVKFNYDSGLSKWNCEINNSFPKLRYNDTQKYFEWALNDPNNSTLRATGIKGERGDKGRVWICNISIDPTTLRPGDPIIVNEYYNTGTNTPVKDIVDVENTVGDTVIALLNNNGKYIGTMYSCISSYDSTKEEWKIPYSNVNISKMDFYNNTYELFKSLHIKNEYNKAEPAQGMFLPFDLQTGATGSTDTRAFAIYSGSTGSDYELHIGAVDDYTHFENGASTATGDIVFDNDIICKGSGLSFDNVTITSTNNIVCDSDVEISNSKKLYVYEIGASGTSDSLNIHNATVFDNNIQVGTASATTATFYSNAEFKNKLKVASTATFDDNVTVNKELTVFDKVSSSNGFYHTSDSRLKEYKGDINVDLDKLLLLPKKYFTWKLDRNGKMEIGTSAQEVQKLYPELVSKNSDGTLTVAYDKLSIVALRAIDILNSKNKELESRIEKLEQYIK